VKNKFLMFNPAHSVSGKTLLLTGASGALGVPLLLRLLSTRAFSRIVALGRGDGGALRAALRKEAPRIGLTGLETVTVELGCSAAPEALAAIDDVDCVLHAAACTQFRASRAVLNSANVDGTRQILSWAEALTRPPRMVHFSTTCVAGQRTGEIAEAALPAEGGFVNGYERSKWQAEQLVGASPLQPEIVRFATVVGRVRDGGCLRPGAFHTTLRWLYAGLLPLMPGDDTTHLDLLPTELATDFICRLLEHPPQARGIYHVSCGARGVPLAELLELAAERFSLRHTGWRTGQILPPVVASRAAFEDFRRSVEQSRDFLFNQVLASVDSFLPELFYPKRYSTVRAESVWGGSLPLPEWRPWISRVIDAALERQLARPESALASA
jgi:2-alkyl-3-oxoalkanoate reductase